ncbi:hypothetical protein EJ03DRAFT_326751 [Teratosphaeria nubilosa]|uniref:Uncharacterized protein n=1 Tax=Teratosphaeria nubilosa TaxID=161662 RepID=A0A6G1LBU3_9PEZI|nr:hypothetical protein EJ03DRAFT_326751 [Teratosphaeria nubilosa]
MSHVLLCCDWQRPVRQTRIGCKSARSSMPTSSPSISRTATPFHQAHLPYAYGQASLHIHGRSTNSTSIKYLPLPSLTMSCTVSNASDAGAPCGCKPPAPPALEAAVVVVAAVAGRGTRDASQAVDRQDSATALGTRLGAERSNQVYHSGGDPRCWLGGA